MDNTIYEQKALIYKALAHPIRIQIAEFLAGGERTVGDIVGHVGAKEANTSRHLAVLKAAGVVGSRKEGLNVFYELRVPCIVNMFSCVEKAILEKAEFHMSIAEKL